MNTHLAPQRLSGLPDTLRLTEPRRRAPRSSTASRSTSACGCCCWSTRTPRLAQDRARARPHAPAASGRRARNTPPSREATPRARGHDGHRGPPPAPAADRHPHRHRLDSKDARMTDTLTGLEFRPLVDSRIDRRDRRRRLREMVRVRNLIYREISGHDDDASPQTSCSPTISPTSTSCASCGSSSTTADSSAASASTCRSRTDSKVAFWLIELLRDVWGRGIGSAAYELVEQTAREHGRTILQSWAEHPAAAGPRIAPPTGFGEIPDDHAARFFLRHGYSLEQVERNSALRPAPGRSTTSSDCSPRQQRGRPPATASCSGSPPTPPEFVDGYAWMKSRMITDAPVGGPRVRRGGVGCRARRAARREVHRRRAAACQVTAAQHIETGELVRVQRARDRQGPHRGHATRRTRSCSRSTAVTSSARSSSARACCSWRDVAPGLTPRDHVQRRGESPHARHQRGDRLRADRVRGRMEEGAR